MSKNIVLCLDGTWNGPDQRTAAGAFTPTNVQQLFQGLSGSAPLGPTQNEMEISFADASGVVLQVAKYIHGIGDTSNVLEQKVEGAVGLGLIARIVRGYTYLSRIYQPGDRIYIIGFSRGSYTARALAGFVVGKGLLDWNAMKLVAGSATSYRAGIAAWQQYKSLLHCDDSGILHCLAECVTDISDRIAIGLAPPPALKLVTDVPVYAVGVWETVGALGVPDICDKDGEPVRKDEFQFADTALCTSVVHGFHAVAVDEVRADFTPTLWDQRDGVVQVLFPGAHSDVGGGYPAGESGLANCALIWMANRLSAAGVLMANLTPGKTDPTDVAHQPWLGSEYAIGTRGFPPTLELSQRVLQRVAAGPVALEKDPVEHLYRPPNLSNIYMKLDWSGPADHTQVDV